MAERMSRAEIAGRVAIKSSALGEPAKVLAEIGGPAAFEDLAYLLFNEVEPPGLPPSDFRCNLIKLLAEVGDERPLGPLLEFYELHHHLEGLVRAALRQAGFIPKPRYSDFTLMMAVKMNEAKLPDPRALPGHEHVIQKLDQTYLRSASSVDLLHTWKLGSYRARFCVIRALDQMLVEGRRQAMAHIFELEQQKNGDLLREVATALGRLGDPRGIDALGQYLEEAARGSESAAQILRLGGTDSIKHVIDDLCGFGHPSARHWVLKLYDMCTDSTKQELRLHAGWRLGLNPEPKKEIRAPAPKEVKEEKSKCFIATAACGSSVAPEVALLRRFRDHRLQPHRAGRAAIALYEHLSPPLADFIRPWPWLRAATRRLVVKPALVVVGFLWGQSATLKCVCCDEFPRQP